MPKPKIPKVTLEQIEDAFFCGMLVGYASRVTPSTIRSLPGSNIISYQKGDFLLQDMYFTNPNSDSSAGQTMIWHKKDLVWTMHYGGYYSGAVIPFLQQVLHQTYLLRCFHGGRGRELVHGTNLIYRNKVESNGFGSFHGREEIISSSFNQIFGTHWYHGMSLLNH